MKIKGLKTIAAVTAVSAGVLFAGANSANASTRVTVQSGDTISKLAKTYNVSMQSIKDANKIEDINRIYVGEVFEIGDDGQVFVSDQNATDTDVVSAPAAQTTTPAVTATAPVATPEPAQTETQAQAAPVQATAPAAQTTTPAAAPVQQAAAPVQATAPVAQTTTPAAPAQPAATPAPAQVSAPAASSVSGSDAAAKDWIAGRESGGNYGAQNGQYVGKYQLSSSYLNGDYSAANQEKVADNYVTSRYGSWSGAQAFWQANGWY